VIAPVTHLVVGPQRHGVVQFGCELHAAMRANGASSALWRAERHDELDWTTAPSALHLQFTDRLFGSSPEESAEMVTTIAARADCRITVTLHDLPQPSDGHNFARRVQAYAAVCAGVHGVVVSSEHERELLGDYAPARVAVVPLPVPAGYHSKPVAAENLSVGIFGYLYPGKGHRETLTAIAHLAADVELVAIGQASDGHADLVAELEAQARDLGVRFRVTGYVSDGLSEVLRNISVPVAPHRHVSASGSLNSWLGAGRRPLAPVNRYSEEMVRRNPDALELYPDTEVGLRTAVKRALDDPGLTWLPETVVCTPTVEDAAAQYARLLRTWHR
jgi:hypothetical protein